MISDKLASNFITELLAYAFSNRATLDVVRAYLKYSYLQKESEKKLVQWVFRRYDKTGQVPTYGQMQQAFIKDEAVLELLDEISDIEIEEDSGVGRDSLIETFQEYLKQMKFLESNDKIVETYNRGDKEAAYNLFVKAAEDMSKFSIMDANFERVFGDFEKRQARRKSEDYNKRYKVPTGVDELDYALGGKNGGPETGEYVLWLGMSGSGKSQCLIHMGIAAARQGFRVVHFQLEGTKEQCMDRYDAAWTGTLYHDMKMGDVPPERLDTLKRIIKKMNKKDIFVQSCEEWGGLSIPDIRRQCKEIEKKYGKIDVIIIDYLELAEVGDGLKYHPSEERFRQQKLSRAMKTLAMEFNCVVHTATQSNDVSLEERNDPEFVLSRSNLNEDRNKLRPTDIFITLNSTIEENKRQQQRLYIDKAREHQGHQVIHICTNFARSRWYDRASTLQMEWDEEEEP